MIALIWIDILVSSIRHLMRVPEFSPKNFSLNMCAALFDIISRPEFYPEPFYPVKESSITMIEPRL